MEEKHHHISYLEMLAVQLTFLHYVKSKSVYIQIDNLTTVT